MFVAMPLHSWHANCARPFDCIYVYGTICAMPFDCIYVYGTISISTS